MRRCLELNFHSWDGANLHCRHWPAGEKDDSKNRKALVLLHDEFEHSGRMQDLVDGLNLANFEAFAYDCRGHGQTAGPRGEAADFSDLVRDLEEFVRWLESEYGLEEQNMAVVASGLGALVAATWVHDYAPRIRCQVLAAPVFKRKAFLPLLFPALGLLSKFKRPFILPRYLSSRWLTHSPEETRKYESDILIGNRSAIHLRLDQMANARRILPDAAAIMTSTLVLSAGRDYIADTKSQRRFVENLGSTLRKWHVFPKFFHGVFCEREKSQAFVMTRDFIRESFAKNLTFTQPDLKAEGTDFSHREYRSLLAAPGRFRSLVFGLVRMAMHTVGRLSDGLRLGWKSGFDSGVSLDYVYRNKAAGSFFIGRIFDRFYLNSFTWKGLRERKGNLKVTLQAAIDAIRDRGQPVRILDIASGPGRYLLEILRDHPDPSIQAHLRDYKSENLVEGETLAKAWQLADRVTFSRADAFDIKSYNLLPWKPNLVIVSGLFELIPDNARVRRAITGILSCLAPGGIVVYTGQPTHPQMEFAGRVLTNREGQFWIMRRRSLYELDQLFAKAGFRKRMQLNDRSGNFTVALAERSMVSPLQRKTAPVEVLAPAPPLTGPPVH